MEENIIVRVGADISGLAREMGKAKQEVADFGSRMNKFGKGLRDTAGGLAMSFGTIATGIALPLKQAVQTSVDFDTALRRVSTIAGATAEEFDALKQTALDLGAKTTKSAREVAEGMQKLAASGYSVNQIIDAMPGVIAAAEASGTDLALTAEVVSSALNAFGLEASKATKVADVLAETANRSNAEIQDLQYSFKYAAPVAASLGVSLEELAAATALMADVGIKGETAGTTLRGGLTQLLKPAEKTAKMMETMGIKVTDANGKFIGLAGVIREFQDAMKGMTDTQKLATLAQIVGTEAASGFLALMKAGPGEIEKMTKALENSGGASQKAAEQMMGGIGGALEQMRGAFETVRIIIGDQLAPYIQKVAEWITKLADKFNNASPAFQKFVAVSLAVVAGLTGFIAVVATAAAGVGLFVMSIAPLVKIFSATDGSAKKTGKSLRLLGGAFRFLFGPIGLIIGVVGGLVAGFVALYKNSDTFKSKIDGLVVSLKSGLISALTTAHDWLVSVKSRFSEIAAVIGEKLTPFIDRAVQAFQNFGANISKVLHGDMSGLQSLFETLIPTILKILLGGIPALIITAAQFLPAISQGIQQNLPTLLTFITNLITNIVNLIGTYLPLFIQAGVNILLKLVDGLVLSVPYLIGAVITVVTTFIDVIAKNFPIILNAGITVLLKLIEGITSALPNIVNAVLTIIIALVDSIAKNLPQIFDAGIKVLNALVDGILSILPTLVAAGLTLIVTIAIAIIKNLPKIIDAGIKILKALISGIIKILPSLIQTGLKLIVMLAGVLIKNLPRIISAGVQILSALLKGIAKLIPQLLALGGRLVLDIAKAIIRKIPSMIKAGADLIRGLWNGIVSVKDWILRKIGGFANDIVSGVKKFFGIKSPSRVMRDQVGRHIGTGVAEGIKRSTRTAVTAAKSQSKAISEAIKNLEVKFDTKKISAWTYINELEKIRKNYKLTGDQARKVAREIYQANQVIKKQQAQHRKTIESINSKVKSANDKFLSRVQSINEKLKKDISALKQDFQEKLTGLTQDIYNQIGLFDSVKTKRVDQAKLIQNLKDQNALMKQFQDDLARLQKMGVSKDFIKELRQMGLDAADEIHAIAAMPKFMLDEYVKAWKEKHALAAKEANTQMADEKAALTKQIQSLTAAAKAEIQKAKSEWIANLKKISSDVAKLGSFRNSGRVLGKSTVQGLINGLKSMKGELQSTTKSLANTIVSTIKKTLGIKSPSRVMRDDVGRWIPAGLVEGIDKMKADVLASARQLSEWATPEVPTVSLAYSTPTGLYGTLSSAVTGTVDVNSREELLARAIAKLERKLDGLIVEMDGREVGRIVLPYVTEYQVRNQTVKNAFKGRR